MNEPEERLAFSEPDVDDLKVTKGVKLKNKRPSVLQQRADAREQFEERADKFMAGRQDRNKLAFDLAKQFLAALKDKTLTENKTPLSKDVENDLRKQLVALLHEIDNDEDEDTDSMGTATIMSLVLKGMFLQRDIINAFSYRVEQLEKELSSLRRAGTSNDRR